MDKKTTIMITLLIIATVYCVSVIFLDLTKTVDSDEIIGIRGDGLVSLASGEHKMLPDHIMDDFNRLSWVEFRDACYSEGIYNYSDFYNVDNLTSPEELYRSQMSINEVE